MTIPWEDTSIMATKLAEATEYGSLASLIPSWERSLRAANKSPKTLRSYGDSARLLDAFMRDSFGITSVASITRDHIETFIAANAGAPEADDCCGEVPQPPTVVQVADRRGRDTHGPDGADEAAGGARSPRTRRLDDDLRKLPKACEGPTFEGRPDVALLRTFRSAATSDRCTRSRDQCIISSLIESRAAMVLVCDSAIGSRAGRCNG